MGVIFSIYCFDNVGAAKPFSDRAAAIQIAVTLFMKTEKDLHLTQFGEECVGKFTQVLVRCCHHDLFLFLFSFFFLFFFIRFKRQTAKTLRAKAGATTVRAYCLHNIIHYCTQVENTGPENPDSKRIHFCNFLFYICDPLQRQNCISYPISCHI